LAIWTGLKHSAHVLKASNAWRESCLQKEGSVFSDHSLWTKQNISQLKTLFVDHPLLDDRPFYEKLHVQIGNAAPEISQLAAEAIWILLLFVYEEYYGVETKRERISEVWSFSKTTLLKSPYLSDDCLRGFANPGTSFLTRIWLEFGFLLTLVDTWKSLSSSEQLSLLQENPWGLCQWVTNIEGGDVRTFRHMFLYFCYPNSFERICSRNNKKQIYAAFASKLDGDRDAYNTDPSPCGLDKSIFEIRKLLQAENNTDELDFYLAPLHAQWQQSGDGSSSKNKKGSTGGGTRFWIEKTIVKGRPDRQVGPHRLGEALWSPQKSTDGKDIYANMREVSPGDMVLHLTDNFGFTGTSIVAKEADDDFHGIPGTQWGEQVG
jgi:hypothetical protein